MMKESVWINCPVCGNKTRTRIRDDTVLLNFPLFCPKCKHEELVNVKNSISPLLTSQPQRRRADNKLKSCYRLFPFYQISNRNEVYDAPIINSQLFSQKQEKAVFQHNHYRGGNLLGVHHGMLYRFHCAVNLSP